MMETEITIEVVSDNVDKGETSPCKDCCFATDDENFPCENVIWHLTNLGLPDCNDGYVYRVKEKKR